MRSMVDRTRRHAARRRRGGFALTRKTSCGQKSRIGRSVGSTGRIGDTLSALAILLIGRRREPADQLRFAIGQRSPPAAVFRKSVSHRGASDHQDAPRAKWAENDGVRSTDEPERGKEFSPHRGALLLFAGGG